MEYAATIEISVPLEKKSITRLEQYCARTGAILHEDSKKMKNTKEISYMKEIRLHETYKRIESATCPR